MRNAVQIPPENRSSWYEAVDQLQSVFVSSKGGYWTLLGSYCTIETPVPNLQTEIPWDDASDADRAAVIELWWAKVSPEPGSDEHLILQMLSLPSMGRGDPDAAETQLFKRGLLDRDQDQRVSFTDSGRAVFYRLCEMVDREYDMSNAEPTLEGIQRHPPDGYFRTEFFGEPVSEPCTCTADCPEWCEGNCGCEACATRLEVFAAPGSAYGEQ